MGKFNTREVGVFLKAVIYTLITIVIIAIVALIVVEAVKWYLGLI